jgi:hypothetical protein
LEAWVKILVVLVSEQGEKCLIVILWYLGKKFSFFPGFFGMKATCEFGEVTEAGQGLKSYREYRD